MHELSIAQEILDIIEAQRLRHGFERVESVRLRAGALSGVNPEALEFAFGVIREGTCAAGADLRIETEPMKLVCRPCGYSAIDCHGPGACPRCGSVDIQIDGSAGVEIVSLEVEQ
ncbi:MAG: hydrogenase maturation nickel metallochaperone HypA [Sedimentisphaerales bacterium]|nr:hydrogenase maturation nickel metallochaperone HypA [Sedimentisphaerales bacterium]